MEGDEGMPTGYTCAIKDGQSFEEFVLGCARAFGANILMRDDESDAPIKEYEPSIHYKQWWEDAKAKLEELNALSVEAAETRAKSEYEGAIARNKEHRAEAYDLLKKYEAMLERVNAWEPPTPEHENMKKFMIEQIESSIDHDCSTDWIKDPALLSGVEWKARNIQNAADGVQRYREEWDKEIDRTCERNEWNRALKDSLK